jgi:hypothetical protein
VAAFIAVLAVPDRPTDTFTVCAVVAWIVAEPIVTLAEPDRPVETVTESGFVSLSLDQYRLAQYERVRYGLQ